MDDPLIVGCKCFVRKAMNDQEAYKEAEILSVRNNKQNITEYYVHYIDYNKRLDEWITVDQVDLTRIEAPKSAKKRTPTTSTGVASKAATAKEMGTKDSSKLFGIHKNRALKRKQELEQLQQQQQLTSTTQTTTEEHDTSLSSIHIDDASQDSKKGEPLPIGAIELMTDIRAFNEEYEKMSLTPRETCSKQQEIENLRRGGSMTQRQEEISRVRNINQIEFGKHRINTWYFSPYPEEICDDQGILYICEFCLLYFGTRYSLRRHLHKCTWKHPPGNEIYRKDGISFFEVDGHKQKTYCRNLCLLSKLFLDHKTLYYDVDPFLFYVLTESDAFGCHMLGYFSKEKESAENYNLACILTLPQHQRKGFGKVLIAFSYELAKRTGHIGSPEKPLSDLGLISYRSYWADEILRTITEHNGDVSIEELSAFTCITCEDILHTVQTLDLLCYFRGQHIILLTEKMLTDHEKQEMKRRNRIDPNCLKWVPPVFSSHQLRYV